MKIILIADDNSGGRELFRTAIEPAGHAVLEAENGVEALSQARATVPDLIMLDLHMPLMDGFAVLEELRRDLRFKATPIAVLTASAMKGDEERAMRAGFTSYIAKPIGPKALRGEVERLLGFWPPA